MKPTKFYGSNEREAFLKVKNSLGDDAVILETRHVTQGGVMGVGSKTMIEITATQNPIKFVAKQVAEKSSPSKMLNKAYQSNNTTETSSVKLKADELKSSLWADEIKEPIQKPQAKNPNTVSDASMMSLIKNNSKLESEMKQIREMVQELVTETKAEKVANFPQALIDLYQNLIDNDVSKDLALGIVNKLKKDVATGELSRETIEAHLRIYINRLIPEHGPLQLTEGRPSYVALIGATGVGKTTTIAKLAAIHKFQMNKKVGFITLDTYRIAAVDQLRKYAEIMNAPLEVVHSPEEFGPAIERLKDRDLVLVDTAGRNQKSAIKKQELMNYFRFTPIEEIYLVLSSTASEKNIQSNIREFSDFPISSLIITKIDEAITYGSILSIVAKANRSVAYITTGQEVPQDIEVSNPLKLTDMILGQVTHNV
jgi:flagellar biosynthesis protein FlhF